MTLATFPDEYAKPIGERTLPSEQGRVDDPTAPFREWTARHPS
jgi:guanine deaminase